MLKLKNKQNKPVYCLGPHIYVVKYVWKYENDKQEIQDKVNLGLRDKEKQDKSRFKDFCHYSGY